LSHETADDVLNALQATGRPAGAEAARRIAEEIQVYGGLDLAIAALANDEAATALAELLAYRAALAEQAAPARRIARLRLEAEGLDARAEPIWAEAAEFHGRAAYRALQGEQELADQYLGRAQAAERLAAAFEAEALAKRLQASALSANAAARLDLASLLHSLAA
jgi:hypothetical protein